MNQAVAAPNNSANSLTWKTVMAVFLPIIVGLTFVMNQGWRIVQSATASTEKISTVIVRVDALEKKSDKAEQVFEEIRKAQAIQAERQYRKSEEILRSESDIRSRLDRMEAQNLLVLRKLKL